jgi:hypothetical protein
MSSLSRKEPDSGCIKGFQDLCWLRSQECFMEEVAFELSFEGQGDGRNEDGDKHKVWNGRRRWVGQFRAQDRKYLFLI